jgi:release factor glutamine methyltransferase
VDVVVSNPPYVADDDTEVEDIVARYEPRHALFSGVDGLDALRTITSGVNEWLRPGGALVLEIGHRQGDALRGMLTSAGLRDVEIRRDAAGRQRIVVARA